jgi:hypothetical protein
MKGRIMKKLVVSLLAVAALTGVAMAGERERDSRLPDPNYGEVTHVLIGGPNISVDKFGVVYSNATNVDGMENRRFDEKNGSRG